MAGMLLSPRSVPDMGCAASANDAPLGTATARMLLTQHVGSSEGSFFDKYCLARKLGAGSYGQVRCLTDDRLAVKILDVRKRQQDGEFVDDAVHLRVAVEEAGAWKAAGHHTNIVVLRDAFLEDGACFFVMERCEQSFQSLLQHDNITEQSLAGIFAELFSGLTHVHEKRVLHRDVKPDNVMVNHGICKLCDFGVATVLPPGGHGVKGIFGSPPYLCPEMLNGKAYKTEVDVWSMGVMLYTFCFGALPYDPKCKTTDAMEEAIREGAQLPAFRAAGLLPKVSIRAQSLVRQLLNRNQKQRISARDALRDSFFTPTAAQQPSLQPVVEAAFRTGAMASGTVSESHPYLDHLLNELHNKRIKPGATGVAPGAYIRPDSSFI